MSRRAQWPLGTILLALAAAVVVYFVILTVKAFAGLG
jgi:hypothetical protein